MLELRGVSKAFEDVQALREVDLEAPEGRTTVLIGPSGCGKSTALRLMLGLLRADAGQVVVEGEDLAEADLQALRRRVGYVIQEGGLFPHLTARGNVALLPREIGWSEARIEERIAELAELVSLELPMLDRYPEELSGGQRQRVSLMRALMVDPDVLLFDEPLGALDPMIRHELQVDLKGIFERLGKTVVIVTHDLAEAAFLADQVVLLRDGEVVQAGTIEDLLEHPADDFVRDFVSAQRSPLGAGAGEGA